MSINSAADRDAAATSSTPSVGYLGWHGRGNLGDDAIYDAVRAQLPGVGFADLPVLPGERFRASLTGLNRSLRRSAQVIGGGTLIGRRHWRRLSGRGLKLTSAQGSYAIGVGVEDPVFEGRRSGSGPDELRRWIPLLSRFRVVSVRGPRSAELLADAGLSVKVAGDPALSLPRPDVAPQDGLIGLNLGFGDDLWGHDPAGVADVISGAVRELSTRGYRFVGILMNGSDRRWTAQALAGTGAQIVAPGDAAGAAAELARCSAVIVSRLHAGILAALSQTPVVSLEYQPKCRDFALSIDDERALMRTDDLSASAVVERVLATLDDSQAIRARTRAAVDALRTCLDADYGVLRTDLGSPAP
ncbi:polysaccharide pyruvyl transferase family protein [Mycolicibacterium goodii]|uniref:polysaccharide pyruvyl transferase family protein n=1 Tax=Mycolicibacterium goodii TaxID=134601 RepID=UPI000C266769|nr:polysaccharide pyruvyl transferase family protein [Mycolicibacterium goodii]PJK22270.1 polysaccharide pyruvyl transferase [Mycolicibacterium goodii]